MTGAPLAGESATVDATASLALVCLGGIPWGQAWKRNQSMVYELAGSGLFERVVFVNPKEMWLRDEIASGKGSMGDRLWRIRDSFPRKRENGIVSLTLIRCLPFKSSAPLVLRLENWGFRTVLNRLIGHRPFVLLNNHPNFYWKGLLAGLMRDATLSVYDLSDDFLEFHSVQAHREVIGRSLEYSCRGSDMVLAVNPHVADRYRKYNENIHVVLNATNTENFQRESFAEVPELTAIRRQAQALFGYAGIINRVRLDYDLVRSTAEARPDWHFFFMGSADPSFLEMVASHPNLHYHPSVSYDELPDWLNAFDAIVVPFERNAHTQGNDLLKVNDALAMGKPVVVAGVECLERYGDLIRVAHGPEEFLQALEEARTDYDPAEVERRLAFARENSWRRRTAAVHALLVQQLRAKLEVVEAE